jgi:hypothetical protein
MAINFVFVQLGSFTPNYLDGNLKRLSIIFPKNEIYLITNNQELLKLAIKNLNIVKYTTSSKHELLLDKLNSKIDFREGFWRLSLERLLALTKFQIQNRMEHLLHLESDVLVFPNLPLDSIQQQNKLLWCQYNSKLDVASLLYSPNFQSASYLQQKIEDHLELNNSHTDMTLLSSIRQTSGKMISLFPSLPSAESHLINPKSQITFDSRIYLSSQFKIFGGIFDPAAIGVWLLGKNLENTKAMSILHDRWIIESGDSYVDPSRVNFVFKPEGSLVFTENGEQIPIFNLHVHSKDFKLLNIDWEREIDKFIKLSKNNAPIKKFKIKIFVKLIILNFKRKNLVEFIATLPWIYSIRMKIRKTFSN